MIHVALILFVESKRSTAHIYIVVCSSKNAINVMNMYFFQSTVE